MLLPEDIQKKILSYKLPVNENVYFFIDYFESVCCQEELTEVERIFLQMYLQNPRKTLINIKRRTGVRFKYIENIVASIVDKSSGTLPILLPSQRLRYRKEHPIQRLRRLRSFFAYLAYKEYEECKFFFTDEEYLEYREYKNYEEYEKYEEYKYIKERYEELEKELELEIKERYEELKKERYQRYQIHILHEYKEYVEYEKEENQAYQKYKEYKEYKKEYKKSAYCKPRAALILKEVLVKESSDENDIVNSIFLYTDEDSDLTAWIQKNIDELDILTGNWSNLYLVEEREGDFDFFNKYWFSILHSNLYRQYALIRLITTKPFNKAECYEIARQLGVSFDNFPCLVLLPPMTEISSNDKLIIPIKEVSTQYFRKLFTVLEDIVKTSQEVNKYEAIKIKFETIIQYLEEKSQQIIKQTETEYQINGTNIFVNSTFRSINMSETNNQPTVNIKDSNIASVTGKGKINEAIVHNYPAESRQSLAEAAAEIQELLEQLSKTYPPTTPENNRKIAMEAIEKIENNPSFKSRIMNAIQLGSIEALKELVDHPAINIFFALVDGWKSAE